METHNVHSATILRALPLGMGLRNLAYGKQAGPSPLNSPLKCCKSTACQESPAQSASGAIHIRPVSNRSFALEITIPDLMSDSAAAAANFHDLFLKGALGLRSPFLTLRQIGLRPILLPMMFNMTGVTGVLAVPSSIFFCTARLAIRPTQSPPIQHVMQPLPS